MGWLMNMLDHAETLKYIANTFGVYITFIIEMEIDVTNEDTIPRLLIEFV